MMTNTLKATLAAALIAGSFATPVLANDDVAAQSVSVRFDDLDLASSEGQARLQTRLNRAAQDVCGYAIRNPGTTMPMRESRRCYIEQLDSFEREVAAVIAAENRG